MVAFLRRQRLNLPVAPLAGGVIGFVTAALFALMPTEMLEDLVVDSGIAAVLSAAEPPLGFTARFILIFLVGGGVGMVAWFALFLLLGTRSIVVQHGSDGAGDERMPRLRRADAHPDAPARRPLSAARDLGTPFLEVHAERPVHMGVDERDDEVIEIVPMEAEPIIEHEILASEDDSWVMPDEQPLPVDLDQPLAAFDPASIPDDPADWFPAPAPLRMTPRRPVFDPGERFDTFDLAPLVPRPAPPAPSAFTPSVPPMPRPDPSATIHALLDRLERSVAKREVEAPAPPPPQPLPIRRQESLEDALDSLRRLAIRR
ncbi:MAG TPA: hypothetical protein VK980_12915 [Sphingomonas sp.]|nr:hypothetical protein [Sphingomonas sp.]